MISHNKIYLAVLPAAILTVVLMTYLTAPANAALPDHFTSVRANFTNGFFGSGTHVIGAIWNPNTSSILLRDSATNTLAKAKGCTSVDPAPSSSVDGCIVTFSNMTGIVKGHPLGASVVLSSTAKELDLQIDDFVFGSNQLISLITK